jgi:hypothetical protein
VNEVEGREEGGNLCEMTLEIQTCMLEEPDITHVDKNIRWESEEDSWVKCGDLSATRAGALGLRSYSAFAWGHGKEIREEQKAGGRAQVDAGMSVTTGGERREEKMTALPDIICSTSAHQAILGLARHQLLRSP